MAHRPICRRCEAWREHGAEMRLAYWLARLERLLHGPALADGTALHKRWGRALS